MGDYGKNLRRDPDPATERVVSNPIRQTTSTRVVETQVNTAPVVASVYSTTATIAGPPDNGAGPVTANWNAEVVDTDTMHDTGVNPNRVTIPATKPGLYRCSCRIVWNSNGAATNRIVRIRVNGTTVYTKTVTANVGSATSVLAEFQQQMNGGDYFDIQLDATGGAGVATTYNPTGNADNSYMVVTKQLV